MNISISNTTTIELINCTIKYQQLHQNSAYMRQIINKSESVGQVVNNSPWIYFQDYQNQCSPIRNVTFPTCKLWERTSSSNAENVSVKVSPNDCFDKIWACGSLYKIPNSFSEYLINEDNEWKNASEENPSCIFLKEQVENLKGNPGIDLIKTLGLVRVSNIVATENKTGNDFNLYEPLTNDIRFFRPNNETNITEQDLKEAFNRTNQAINKANTDLQK